MNTTVNINLGGSPFCIDQTAYEILQSYLQSVERNLSSDTDKKDVMDDIEHRIAELFAELQKKQHQSVITAEMVQIVINQMGKPDDFKDDEQNESFGTKSVNYAKNLFSKHLYRDTDNQVIAGVCSGLAAWLGISAVWVRLAFVLCLIFWGITAVVYIILWLIIPEARTAAQRLELQGKEVTVEKIEEEVRNQKDKTSSSGLTNFLATLLKICVWVVGGGLLLFIAIILFSVLIGLFGAFTGIVAISPIGMLATIFDGNAGIAIALVIMLLLTIGLPVFGLIYALIKYFGKGEQISSRNVGIWVIIWILSLIGSVGIGIWTLANNEDMLDSLTDPQIQKYWHVDNDDDDSDAPLAQLAVSPFHSIEISGAAKVQLYQSNEQYIEATIRNNDDSIYSVTDSVLKIKTPKKGLKINIYTPDIRNISFSGAAELENIGTFHTDQLAISTSGAGEIDLDIETRILDINTSGASEVELKGQTDVLRIDIAGASEIDADKLLTRKSEIQAMGASKVDVNVTDSLTAVSAGRSKIRYKGNPVVSSSTYGGGKVVKKLKGEN